MASLAHIDWKPDRAVLRNFGLIALAAFGIFGALARWQLYPLRGLSGSTGAYVAVVLWVLAAYCGLFAFAAPAAVRPIYLFLTIVTYPIGFVLSYVVLGIMYYLVFTPVGIVFKIIGRDALHRAFDPSAPTYWIRRRPPQSVSRYFRQF